MTGRKNSGNIVGDTGGEFDAEARAALGNRIIDLAGDAVARGDDRLLGRLSRIIHRIMRRVEPGSGPH